MNEWASESHTEGIVRIEGRNRLRYHLTDHTGTDTARSLLFSGSVHRQNKHELGIASLSDLYQSNPQLVFVLPVGQSITPET